MPPAEEQRAIICCLESDTTEESLHVYTVSQMWYERWRAYVGLLQSTARLQSSDEAATAGREDLTVSGSPSSTGEASTKTFPVTAAMRSASAETCEPGKETSTENKRPAPPPGPIEMDLNDEDNISVDEKVKLLGLINTS